MPTEAPLAFDASEPPMDSLYELHAGPYRSGELRLLSFSGREEVNGIYAFEVLFWAKHVDEARLEGELLGAPSAIGMHVPGGPARWVRGIVVAITLEGAHPGGRHAFRMSLVPRLWLLGKRVNSRIFQDKTVQQIVDVVLDEHGIMREWSLLAKYPERQYCVQYQESDLQFVIRMLAEEGIFFSFVHPEGEAATECLQLADSAHSYAPIDGDPKLVYRHQTGDGAMKAEENQVLDFRLRTRMEPTAVVMRDYDFRRPKLDLTSTTSALVSSAQDPTTTRPLEHRKDELN